MKFKDICSNIYVYFDFRNLLSDFFLNSRKLDSKYSMRYFSKRMGFGSPNYIQKILAGDRKISEKSLDSFIRILEFDGKEREYFDLLVKMGQSNDLERRNSYFKQLAILRKKQMTVTTLDEAQYACISSWTHWVVREMAFLKGDLENVKNVAHSIRAQVTPSDVSRCLKDLEQAGLLIRQSGRLKAAMSSINFPEEVRSLALMNYHQAILKQSMKALEQQNAKEREFGAVLVATTPDKYEQVKEKLKKVRREVMEILDTPENEATQVASFSFQMFQVVSTDEDE